MSFTAVRLSVVRALFAAKAQPDQVDRPADSHEQANEGKDPLVQPLVQPITDAAPENQAR